MNINVLHVLDEMDTIRRNHYHECQPPADFYFRTMEATLAHAAGFQSRNEWTEKLKHDPTTQYYKDYHNPDYKGHF